MSIFYKFFLDKKSQSSTLLSGGLLRTFGDEVRGGNENNRGFSFRDILFVSNELGNFYLDKDYAKVKELFKRITNYFKNVDTNELKEATNDELNELIQLMDSEPVSNEPKDFLSEVQVTGEKPIGSYSKNLGLRHRSRFRNFNFNLSRTKKIYLVSHLTNADLSMLCDFNELKDSLDIVNKSFVTLGRPIIVDSNKVYIRDTLLLAPAGKKSLASLGNLMGFNKIDLTPK